MNTVARNALAVAAMAITTQAAAPGTSYEREGFQSRSFTTQEQVGKSMRAVSRDARSGDNRDTPAPAAASDYRRRNNERLYEANVTSVRAVVGTAGQRCWIEREHVVQDRSNAIVPAVIAGAHIGGILGHQVGSGTGRVIATVGGAVAGAALGSNRGRDRGGQQAQTQDVQRCENVPDYWDVTYVR